MAQHKILFTLPEFEMNKVDARFIIKKDRVKLGEIRVSKGGLDYYPSKRKIGIPVTWTQLDALLKKFEKEKIM